MADVQLIPVDILTGFLGSGKTTLLRRALESPRFANTAVLVNEFGEVGLDHLLVTRLDESAVLLSNGCICCTVRDDLKTALLELMQRRGVSGVALFDRIVIETTGLADPVPIIATLMRDRVLRHHVRLGNVIATVDAINAESTLDGFSQSARQIGVADKIVLTKMDLADKDAIAEVETRIRRINAAAPIVRPVQGMADFDDLFGHNPSSAVRDLSSRFDVDPPTRFRADRAGDSEAHGLPASLSIIHDEPLEWAAFGLWLSLLVARHGDRILRIKGIVHVAGSETPIAVHGVQTLLHPAEHLPAWPDDDRRTRLVLIGYGLDRELIQRSLTAFLKLGQRITGGRHDRAPVEACINT